MSAYGRLEKHSPLEGVKYTSTCLLKLLSSSSRNFIKVSKPCSLGNPILIWGHKFGDSSEVVCEIALQTALFVVNLRNSVTKVLGVNIASHMWPPKKAKKS